MKVVEVGNITRASEQLFVAQPALGLQIRQLEEELGVPLLVRHSRGVVATEPGQLLYRRSLDILSRVASVASEIKALDASASETLILGLTPSIMTLLGHDILIDARDRLPNVLLSLVEEMSFVLVEALDREELDIALAYEYVERPGISATPLFEEELLFVTAAGRGEADVPVALEVALASDLVLASERDLVRRMVLARAQSLGIKLNVVFEAQSVALMKTVVARGHAATIMPFGTCIAELRRGDLVGRRIDRPLLRRLFLLRRSKRAPFRAEADVGHFLAEITARLRSELGPLVVPPTA